ncbi:DUF3237 family protein [Aurantiacibacter flavus]|uniref:UPF0311 protein ABDJ38_02705 n=1 Tax=Aurantiacibacter flavus TaxID=3145232 RepID=A0ABV0CTU0_9SPHN
MKVRTFGVAAAAGISLALGSAAQGQQAPSLEHVFTITAELGETLELGPTGRGNRRIIPITGGTVEGEGISGTVRPGAWDWQLDRPDGCTDLIADYFLETDDGGVINVRNTATVCRAGEGEPPISIFTRPQFEPQLGKYEWLGRGVFVGHLEPVHDGDVSAVRIAIYQVN